MSNRISNKLILDEMRGCFDFFWNESNSNSTEGYGLTLDKLYLKKENDYKNDWLSSVACVGFGLCSYMIGVERGWITFNEGYERSKRTLETIKNVETYHGLLPHFLFQETGKTNGSEFSTIDTAIFLMGAVTCGEYFKSDVRKLAMELYNQVDWCHFLREKDGKLQLNMAYSNGSWRETKGYCPANWDHYAEQMMIYLLIGGRSDIDENIALNLFDGFDRNIGKYKGNEFVYCFNNPLFIHQFTHCFFDFRKYLDKNGYDWFKNSVDATIANRRFCIDQKKHKSFGKNSWGLTAFQGKDRYMVFGSPPQGFEHVKCNQRLEAYVAPYGALSSINFLPNEVIKALKHFTKIKGLKQKYGFTDSYNLDIGYVSDCYIGIDKGPTIIMLDNYLYGTIWKYFMNSEVCQTAIKRLKFIKREN